MEFKQLKANSDGVVCGIPYHDTFYISACFDGFKLHVEPEFRFNGTQNHNGYFPRYYKKPQYAKSVLTKFLGESLQWQEITD